MAEENVVDQSTQEEVVDNTPVVSPDEALAREHGWKPKEEWEGDPDDWISHREFNRRGELFSRIAKYGHEIKEQRDALKKLFDQNRRLYDAGYSKAVADLKAQKMNALEENDARRVVMIDEEIDALKEQHQNKIKEFDRSVTPESSDAQVRNQVTWDQWTTVNSWYNTDTTLRNEAEDIARTMVKAAQNQGKTVEYAKLLTEVARQVKAKYPDRFPKAAQRTSAVDGGSREVNASSAKAGGRYTLDRIPAEEREIAKTIINSGALSEEDYVKQYVQANRR